ncbi:amidohydrolase [Paenarthrobacter ureafaciens]|uniref:amidohydrolase n=1 Tax=Paenarthrobacter ureafaciens TaxID=37931 RepID=UPI001FB49C1C|nr:amidohydrolase [Paenarthrobacter ureafaciens]UOD82121.1 amidohydrolase [Paenarthrobacter ureafaciens]WNZ05617.1 amidohydrolase [Paenarthrobacter ureafaciens]
MGIDLEELYKDLHAHPELSFQEVRTAGIVAGHLDGLGLQVHRNIGKTGVVGVLRNGEGPVVMLRADMDALPVKEATGLDYASTAMGVDHQGLEVPVMHACGHDVHVTCLIGAVAELVRTQQEWHGTLIAIFQPAEEFGGGADTMVKDGLYDRIPKPEVVLGQHVAPVPAGWFGLCSGVAMASADSLNITLHGRGGHGSRPETTVDPVLMAAAATVRLQGVVAREIAASDSAVVTVGQLHAGTKNNIIPETATLGLSIRSFSEPTREKVLAAVERIVRSEAAASGAAREPDFNYEERFPLTVNDDAAAQRVDAAFRQKFGAGQVIDPGPVSGSEDVGMLATAAGAPLVFWFLGGIEPHYAKEFAESGRLPEDVPSNHSPYFAPVIQPTLTLGTEALVTAAREFLA